jgi:hypothetical protein
VVFLSALVAGALGTMVDRRKASGQNSRALAPRMARGLAFGISATNVLFVIGVMLFLRNGGTQYGIPPYFMVFLGMALGAAILTTGLVIFATLAWRGEYRSLAGRMHYTLVTLVAVAFVWLLNYWNLLGFRY